ncbi:Fatty acid hydroxylase [Lasallia pustulata]|uniref:Fatty acid hydroxylase n=1 Tax=Lasallia pustulata TaxID=136370 RepID=A0A1W5D6I4_9LECA|nr:Fatty acid hydroxylase [Lasallia pustulata]
MANATSASYLPPPPTCNLTPRPSLIPGVSDHVLGTVLPTLVYIIASGFFYWLSEQGSLSQYRIHPSEEELKRNHVSRSQCLRVVVRYHVMQVATGLLLSYGEGPELTGSHSCDVYRWAVRVRHAQKAVPWAFALVGIDAKGLALTTYSKNAVLVQLLAGNSKAISESNPAQAMGFTASELLLAEFIVSYAGQAAQFLVALSVVDTWIYFTHRLCHVNKTLYRVVHAQHHQLYVSYAYGAVYGHWLESIFLDILSFVMANAIAGLSARQSMVFGSLATIKTISDHCGYVFPLDPFRYVNNNGARFHDLHHQTWGLKNNFSTYTVFWDNLLGTTWTDKAGAAARYSRVHEQTKRRAEKAL